MNTKIKMHKKFPQLSPLQINAIETKQINLCVSEDGEFLVANDTEISPGLFYLSRLYEAKENKANVLLLN